MFRTNILIVEDNPLDVFLFRKAFEVLTEWTQGCRS